MLRNHIYCCDIPVFEPEGEKEHEAEYKKIHEDYKNLVHTHILLFLILDASVFMFLTYRNQMIFSIKFLKGMFLTKEGL